jgi:RHS repeat-associated protein
MLLFSIFVSAEEIIVDLQDLGKIIYCFEEGICEKIVRLSPSGEIRYEHVYHYDQDKRLVSEHLIGGLGEIIYSGNLDDGTFIARTPFGEESWSKEDGCTFEKVDVEKVYDTEGFLIQKGTDRFFYECGKLVQVLRDEQRVFIAYDQEGKRVFKKRISEGGQKEEYYLYLGESEIGSVSENGELNWLRIPGMTTHPDLVRAIAIETKDAIYAPIYDLRWNIVKLVNIVDGSVLETRPDPFGQNLITLEGCPWTFCSKRYDPDIGLVNFGFRDYDPELREWTSLDPLMQDSNPYRYCFDDPLHFLDPDGRFALVVPILTWGGAAITSPIWGTGALAVAGGMVVGYLGYKGYQYVMKSLEKESPYGWDDLGYDPSRCPDEGYIWKGSGTPSSRKGNWVRGEKPNQETLYPDLEHPLPIGPHWDYTSPEFPNGIRIKPDGTWEEKPSKDAS